MFIPPNVKIYVLLSHSVGFSVIRVFFVATPMFLAFDGPGAVRGEECVVGEGMSMGHPLLHIL